MPVSDAPPGTAVRNRIAESVLRDLREGGRIPPNRSPEKDKKRYGKSIFYSEVTAHLTNCDSPKCPIALAWSPAIVRQDRVLRLRHDLGG